MQKVFTLDNLDILINSIAKEAVTSKKTRTSQKVIYRGPQLAIFVDWENINVYAKQERWQPEPERLCEYIESLKGTALRYFYQTDYRQSHVFKPTEELSRQGARIQQRGFIVREKRIELGYFKKQARAIRSANLDVYLVIDVMDALKKYGGILRKVVLVSGDGDFAPLVVRIKEHRSVQPIKVVVLSWLATASHKLMDLSDEFIPLEKMKDWVVSVPSPVKQPELLEHSIEKT